MSEWTPERHEAAKARCDAASPGPWEGDRRDGSVKYELRDPSGEVVLHVDHKNGTSGFDGHEGNESFVRYARADLPDALAEIERLQAENARLKAALRTALACVIEMQEGVGPDLDYSDYPHISRSLYHLLSVIEDAVGSRRLFEDEA